MRTPLALVLLCSLVIAAQGQSTHTRRAPLGPDGVPHFAGDTLRLTTLAPSHTEVRRFARKQKNYDRLKLAVLKTYPYARLALRIIRQAESEIAAQGLKPKEERNYTQRLEKELFKKYETDLRKLTVYQGQVLIKLIDRETGITAYQLIKDFRSGRTAFLYQMVARIYGSNLKSEYDPALDIAVEAVVNELLADGLIRPF